LKGLCRLILLDRVFRRFCQRAT